MGCEISFLLTRYKTFILFLVLLSLGVILNDAAENVKVNLIIAAIHQSSILLIFFAAFFCGVAGMYDLLDKGRRSWDLVKGIFIYSAVIWCFVAGTWAVGYYFIFPVMTGGIPSINVLAGVDTPFSFGFFAPTVPRLIMVAFDAASLIACYLIWVTKSARLAILGVILPVVFVDLWAFTYGTITIVT